MTSVEVAIRFFERHLKEDILKYGERQAIHMAISALREQGGSFQNGNDHKTVKDWPPYMDLPREQEIVTKCHDLYDEDGGEILAQDALREQEERSKGCDWCEFFFDHSGKFQFCPQCGRRLEDT